MNKQQWSELTEALQDVRDADRAAAAAKFLHENAAAEDVPRLMEMLNDEDIVVREAAAWPLGELAGLAALPQLLAALQRGFDDGHDCDSLQAVLIEVVEADKAAARHILTGLIKSSDKATRENAQWLWEFCETPPNA